MMDWSGPVRCGPTSRLHEADVRGARSRDGQDMRAAAQFKGGGGKFGNHGRARRDDPRHTVASDRAGLSANAPDRLAGRASCHFYVTMSGCMGLFAGFVLFDARTRRPGWRRPPAIVPLPMLHDENEPADTHGGSGGGRMPMASYIAMAVVEKRGLPGL